MTAATLYQRALGVAPWWAEGHYNQALILSDQQRYAEAVTAMKAFVLLAAASPDARTAQGKLYEWELEAK
jgi:hypothetical protein